MEQAPKGEMMTQVEIDALLRDVATGNLTATSHDNIELAKKARNNFKQLEYAMKRCEIENLANVGPEELPARFAQVHYYAHRNWLLQRGFTSKKDFRAFMNNAARKKGITLKWGGIQ
jgi:hypothetical protein